jgi:hypothetical protein
VIDRLPFIEHEQAQKVFDRINTVVRAKGIGILEGLRATGKTRLLEEYITAQRSGIAGNRLVLAKLHQTYRKSLLKEDSQRIGSPMTLWLFDQLDYVLKRLGLPINKEQRKLLEAPGARIHTATSFSGLYRRVLEAMRAQRIRAIIVDNAHHLDAFALEWLMALREELRPQPALLLCATLQPNEQTSHTLNLALSQVAGASDSLIDRFQLAQLSPDDFLTAILPHYLFTLQIELDDYYQNSDDPLGFSKLSNTLWSWHAGNWILLDRVSRLLLEACSEKGQPLKLTSAIMEQVQYTITRLQANELSPL